MSDKDHNDKSADSSREYEIGYGKPPKSTQFKKGVSGNPSGRRKGSRSTKDTIRAILNEPITVHVRRQR